MWGKVFGVWGEILPPSEYIATYLGTHIGGSIRKVSVWSRETYGVKCKSSQRCGVCV